MPNSDDVTQSLLHTCRYLNSSEWVLESTSVNTTVLEYDSGGQILRLPTVSMYVDLSRVASFYVAAIMFPCIMLVLVSIMVFLLPPESGEKMALAITVLLSFTVVIVMVADVTPRTSNLPLFREYTFCHVTCVVICDWSIWYHLILTSQSKIPI